MQSPFTRLLVLLDYDGTITAHECNELVFQTFTGNAWRPSEEALNRGLIGHAECLRRQVALVRVPRERFIAATVDAAELAPHFSDFLKALTVGGARVAVVSAGFRQTIEAVWLREGLPPVELFASELAGSQPPFDVSFNPSLGDCPVCGEGACKGGLARTLRRAGDVVAVFGDGHSDLCMAREADLVFARGSLADLCRAEGLESFELSDYQAALARLRTALITPVSAGIPRMNDVESSRPEAAARTPSARILERIPVGLRQFVKFAVVGGTGTLVNFAVFSLLLYIWHHARGVHAGFFEQVSVGIAFCVAVASNFLLNRRWTFRHTGRIIPHFGRFFVVSLVGLGLNELVFTLLHNLGGVEVHVSQLLAILVVTPFNFVGSKWWAFR